MIWPFFNTLSGTDLDLDLKYIISTILQFAGLLIIKKYFYIEVPKGSEYL